ncbi:hypothetical protein DRN75_02330 [Nanoarchaeota archaeon]|nr:MAG: hypothetical protein DRN75_02330 [Nanoarchaeota archaeon]
MVKLGQKNQIYGKLKRILINPENPNELYLVLEKDRPMERKYIRQFEDMFAGKDVIVTLTELIRKEELLKKKAKSSPFYSIGEET